jgi:hypothetical protein
VGLTSSGRGLRGLQREGQCEWCDIVGGFPFELELDPILQSFGELFVPVWFLVKEIAGRFHCKLMKIKVENRIPRLQRIRQGFGKLRTFIQRMKTIKGKVFWTFPFSFEGKPQENCLASWCHNMSPESDQKAERSGEVKEQLMEGRVTGECNIRVARHTRPMPVLRGESAS